jgi:cell division septation protein DedD
MQVDIPAHIEKLLFLHDALIIPGFGGFTTTRTPAAADFVGGTVSPPSKTLAFSENLTVDDGILVDDIAKTHSIPTEDAQRAVAEFVRQMQALLGQREIVTLPGVGRLYQNYVQKIQFLPDSTNFNAASYGLLPLQFSPIARSREIAPPATTEPLPNPTGNQPSPTAVVQGAGQGTPRSRGGWGPWLGLVFLLFSLGFGIWYWQQRKKEALKQRDNTAQETAAPPTAPKHSADTGKTPEKTAEKSPEEPPENPQAENPESPTANLPERECILVVATLQEKVNADRLLRMLKNDGHQVYFLEKNGYQVGVQFRYKDPKEVQETISILRSLTGEKQIWIKKK